jgi:hypothetical protein
VRSLASNEKLSISKFLADKQGSIDEEVEINFDDPLKVVLAETKTEGR